MIGPVRRFFTSRSWKCCELRAKQAAARSTKGVVGSIGRTIPAIARSKAVNPAVRYNERTRRESCSLSESIFSCSSRTASFGLFCIGLNRSANQLLRLMERIIRWRTAGSARHGYNGLLPGQRLTSNSIFGGIMSKVSKLINMSILLMGMILSPQIAFSETSKEGSSVSDLIKKDNKVGTGEEAVVGKRVEVHYTGWLYDGNASDKKGAKFDSPRDRGAP